MRIVKTGEGDKVFLKSYVWSRTYRCYNVRRNDSEKADVNARDGSEKAASAQVKEGLGTLESVGQHGWEKGGSHWRVVSFGDLKDTGLKDWAGMWQWWWWSGDREWKEINFLRGFDERSWPALVNFYTEMCVYIGSLVGTSWPLWLLQLCTLFLKCYLLKKKTSVQLTSTFRKWNELGDRKDSSFTPWPLDNLHSPPSAKASQTKNFAWLCCPSNFSGRFSRQMSRGLLVLPFSHYLNPLHFPFKFQLKLHVASSISLISSGLFSCCPHLLNSLLFDLSFLGLFLCSPILSDGYSPLFPIFCRFFYLNILLAPQIQHCLLPLQTVTFPHLLSPGWSFGALLATSHYPLSHQALRLLLWPVFVLRAGRIGWFLPPSLPEGWQARTICSCCRLPSGASPLPVLDFPRSSLSSPCLLHAWPTLTSPYLFLCFPTSQSASYFHTVLFSKGLLCSNMSVTVCNADSISSSQISYLQYKLTVVRVARFWCPRITYHSARQVPYSQSVACKRGQIMLISWGCD